MITVTGQQAPGISLPVATKAKAAPQPPSPEALRALDEARGAVRVRLDLAAQRKAHARETVERLKEQINKLSPLAIVDPKALARVIHGLAKQLAGAAEEYAATGDPRRLRDEAEQVTKRADALEGKPAAAPPPPASDRERVAQAYLAVDPDRLEDEKFVADTGKLRKLLEMMFKDAAERAAAHDPNSPEIGRLVADFGEVRGVLTAAEATIAGWWQDPPHMALPEGSPVDLKV